MRNPQRIKEILKELEIFWYNNSDLRLGQIISNLSYELSGDNDPFFIEDDNILILLKNKNKQLIST